MKRLISFLLVLFASHVAHAQDLRLPFNGRWFVMQGGDTLNVNQHMATQSQYFGIDFVKVGGPTQRQLSRGIPTKNEDFFSWNETVVAPADGLVVAVTRDLPDNPLGVKDAQNPAGNFVAIQIAPNRFLFLAHFKKDSLVLKVGDRLKRGEAIGKCGNSGNSDYPHIHLHIQDKPTLNEGIGQNPIFSGMDVELTGKTFENVTWPLIAGLWVWPR